MQLNITTDYGIRVLLCLRETGVRLTGEQISGIMAIPDRYLLKVLKKLKNSGLILSHSGKAGGYELSRNLSEIAFWDVLVSMEETMALNSCLQDEEKCSRHATRTCPVRKFYCGLQAAAEQRLKNVSLAQILEQG